jgi:uncharacterized protein with PIN domain
MYPPRFAVDAMLGHLATWLRLIGRDATYGAHRSGQALLRHARSEHRTVLTRDRRLLRQHGEVPLLFIKSDHFREQLQQVMDTFHLDPLAHIFTRCARCNAPVVPVAKPSVRNAVPPYVFETQEHFVRCPRCQRLYWPATHYERIRNELRALLGHPESRP